MKVPAFVPARIDLSKISINMFITRIVKSKTSIRSFCCLKFLLFLCLLFQSTCLCLAIHHPHDSIAEANTRGRLDCILQ